MTGVFAVCQSSEIARRVQQLKGLGFKLLNANCLTLPETTAYSIGPMPRCNELISALHSAVAFE